MTTRVTLSFDDGHPNDLRLARILRRLGLRATFYIPLANSENELMTRVELLKIRDMGFEIGSHGLTHRRLHTMEELEARREFYLSRRGLEKILEEPVRGFCFSGGKTRHPLSLWAAQEGYDYCRTTRMFRQSRMRLRNLLHTSLQWYPHGYSGYLRHLLRRPKAYALAEFVRCKRPLLAGTAASLFDEALSQGRPFHLWGHSYEFVGREDWRNLEAFLEGIAGRSGVAYVNNSELFDALLQS